ncbi:MAG: DUF2851 family protein [Verrucomicrobiota bacterium]
MPPFESQSYEMIRSEPRERVRERALFSLSKKLREIEVQARWFSGEFGRKFTTVSGGEIEVVQFGVWNREAGPDFSEAAITINGGAPVRGCIELDFDVHDWERHGHATNPAYETVVLHIFLERRGNMEFFTRTAGGLNVPQIRINVEEFEETPPVSIAKPGRCLAVLRDLPEAKVRSILRGAAQYRMKKKAARFARLAELHGEDEALYQSLAVTLGYKVNKLPFMLMAQRVPLRILREHKRDADAILFGLAGFLNAADLSDFDRETRVMLRDLWDRWWSRRLGFERLSILRGEWRMSGQRPANHPQRRVAALTQIVKHWPKVRALAAKCEVTAIHDFFAGLGDEYWDHHYTLTSARSAKRMALIGGTRVSEMLANVFFPRAVLYDPSRWNDFEKLPAALNNRRAGIAALRLFGGNPEGARYLKTTANQQGLLQIYDDFCAHDSSDCVECRFPEQLISPT